MITSATATSYNLQHFLLSTIHMNYNLQQKELSTPLQLGTLALLPKNPVQGLPKHSLQIDTQQDVLGRYAMQVRVPNLRKTLMSYNNIF